MEGTPKSSGLQSSLDGRHAVGVPPVVTPGTLVCGSAEISVLDGQLSGEGAAGQEATPVSPASTPPVTCQETLHVEEAVPAKWPACRKVSPQT